jgi:hypothetical protein
MKSGVTLYFYHPLGDKVENYFSGRRGRHPSRSYKTILVCTSGGLASPPKRMSNQKNRGTNKNLELKIDENQKIGYYSLLLMTLKFLKHVSSWVLGILYT